MASPYRTKNAIDAWRQSHLDIRNGVERRNSTLEPCADLLGSGPAASELDQGRRNGSRRKRRFIQQAGPLDSSA
jgi:hypothetical protein